MTKSAMFAAKTSIVSSFGANLSRSPSIILKENSYQLIFLRSSQSSRKMKCGSLYRARTIVS
jgi:hypothetical protein